MSREFIEVLSVKEFANTELGSLGDSDSVDIKCDARIKVFYGGTCYYIPLYNSVTL